MKEWGYILSCLFLLVLSGCRQDKKPERSPLDRQRLETWKDPSYSLSSAYMRRHIDSLRRKEPLHLYADDYTERFYAGKQPFLWIDRNGTDERADSLLTYLEQTATACGLPSRLFPTEELRVQLRKLRQADVKNGEDLNRCMAGLEYGLTRSFLRLACGQRYGFLNPRRVFNRLEKQDTTANAPFRQLFDFTVETATDSFVTAALQAARKGEAAAFLRQTAPTDELYRLLQQQLATAPDTSQHYRSLCANMERRRWRYNRPADKYVWVNVAAYELRAVDEETDSLLSMKVCVGSPKHKTPLLYSHIRYAELNPYWVVPYNIVKEEIAPLHSGKADYFIRNRMKIIEKGTKREMRPEEMTRSMYLSGQYTVRQESGDDNSLGRIVFRFNNNFSVFLHDTNNKRAFKRSRRALSHGCIRVERPLELAIFLMDRPDELAIDKIRLAIDLPPLSPQGKEWAEADKYKPIGIYRYKPEIPVFLDYYTIYPDEDGQLRDYGDPYDYDAVILKNLGWF